MSHGSSIGGTTMRAAKRRWLAVAAVVAVVALAGCDPTPPLVRGTITTEGGQAAGGVTVALYSAPDTQVAATTTDVLGEYTFGASSGLSEGVDYRLRIGDVWWPTTDRWNSAGIVQVTTGVTTVHDAVVYPSMHLAGTVVDAAGAPMSEATVGVVHGDTQALVGLATTGPDGTFEIAVHTAGPYRIGLWHQDHPLVTVGGVAPATFDVSIGNTNIGTIDISTGSSTPPAFKAIDAGGGHTCAVARDDTLRCWGADSSGQATPPAGTFTAVTAGQGHSCAIATDDTIACWGYDDSGQSSPPAGAYEAVSAGNDFTCALATDGTIACWGGQAWQNVSNPPDGTFRSISAGWDSACAIATDDTITCWGAPDEELEVPPPGPFATVSVGAYHACALGMDGSVTCWGSEAYGGELDPPDGSYATVDSGSFSSCGLTTAQAVACWGLDAANPIGSYTAVATGDAFACAIATDGTTTCWGFDYLGQTSSPSG